MEIVSYIASIAMTLITAFLLFCFRRLYKEMGTNK